MMALLAMGSSGAWAVTPTADAIPIVGKTYYLFAMQKDGSRSYLYNNDGTLTISKDNKENTDAYKWTVAKSGDNYTITNVAGNSLNFTSATNSLGLYSNAATFQLDNTVTDAACVSIYNSGYGWFTAPKTSQAMPTGQKVSTFPATVNDNYSPNFVFEEVLTAHSLEDGALYTIWCDNDSKQYLYDSGEALLVSNESSSSLSYVFKCIVNGDYYNFRNVKTGKYLAFKGRNSTATDFTISTTNAKHDGCATIQNSSSSYWVMNANNNFDQSSITYYKGYQAYSTDFRFEKVTLENYYEVSTATGTLGSGNWTNTWTHSSAPAFTLTASANNISSSLQLASGSAGSSTYTLTAPVGYIISEYTLAGTGNNQTVTVSGGTATSFTSSINYVEATPRSNKATFVIAGANSNHIAPVSFMVKVEPMTSVTDVASIDASKSYNIYNNRGVWTVANDADVVNSTTELGLAYLSSDAKQKFAFIPYNDKYYLYSVSQGKFAYIDGTKLSLTRYFTTEVAASPVTFASSTNATYMETAPVVMQINGSSFGVHTSKTPDVYMYSPYLDDAGNASAIYEAGDFDNTAALAQIVNTTSVTYHLIYNGSEKDNAETYALVGGDLSVPSSLDTYCMSYKYYSDAECTSEITTVPAGGGNVYAVATWAGPVKFTATTSAPEYYNLNIRSQYLVYNSEATGAVTLQSTSEPFNDAASWAFIGDPYTGFKIINKANGTDKYLTYTSVVTDGNSGNNNIQFIEDASFTNQYWYIDTNTGGFCLRMKENTNIYFHHDNDNQFLRTCSVSEWSAVHNDAGSTIIASTDEDVLFALYESMKDWTFGTSIGQMNTTDEATITNATAATTLESIGNVITSATTAAYPNAYAALLQIQNNMALVEPTVGYYRLKNVSTGKYLTATALSNYTSSDRYVYANGDATSAATVISLAEGNDGMYMYNQGYGFGWVDAQKEDGGGVGYLTETADKYVHWFPGKAANQTAFAICLGNGVGGYSSYLTRGIYTVDTEDEAVIGGTDYTADAAQWVVETATSATISLNKVDGTSYATMYVPFDITLPEGTKAYTVTISGERAQLNAISGTTIPSNTPVLLVNELGSTSIVVTITTGASALETENALNGTYFNKTSLASDEYIFGTKDGELGFWKMSASSKVGANKAYLVVPASTVGVKGFSIDFSGITGIEAIDGAQKGIDAIYNLAGQRVEKAQRGIYILNGKKVVIK